MSFGTSFGAATPASQPSFNFGSQSTTATPVKPTGFGTPSFGFSTPATTAPSLFGTQQNFGAQSFGTPSSNFGTSTSATTNTFTSTGSNFGFGTQNSSSFGAPVSSSFGAPVSSTFGTTSNFGAPTSTFGAPTTSNFGFGNFNPTTTTPSLFGNFPTTSAPAFGSSFTSFAKPATTFTGFGQSTQPGFGAQTSLAPGFGGTSLGFGTSVPQAQQPATASEALYNAVFNCQLFNDERDNTIARWNLIQALWGTGKAYYATDKPPLELNQENLLCRFKAIGYSCMPTTDNNDGLVVLCFNKKENDLKESKPQLITSLTTILGNKPNLTVNVDNVKASGDSKCQVAICVTEKGVTGSVRKIPANELVGFLSQPVQKQQLTSLGVENMFAQVKLDAAALKEYLENPPCAIDPRLWKQAQLDNPNPETYIPVPMIGFQQVKYRLKCQEEETARHRAFLDQVADKIQELQRAHTATQARLKEHRRSLLELQHRVLQVLVKQEITRKVGLSLQPDEEVLTRRFEAMHAQISAPTQFKGRISEMLSQLRMRRHVDLQGQERYTMDPIAQDDIKAYLGLEQDGMAQLIDTISTDLDHLKVIKDGMADLLTGSTA
ncbi:nuclear pore complex protein Nup54 [Microplitis mediator]|uniref:nuclear pore complex protein Nup54 n=1 Tax=Microplitis mediator TaxID=375433 RepID=UPI00255726E6|nr:nuclear pore complex protein Nup54 [Microplitis mediator]